MNFYSTNMINTSTRKDIVNHITIEVKDGLTSELKGTAKMVAMDDIYLELPETQGRYRLKARAIKALADGNMETLDDLFHKAWLLGNGDYILRNLELSPAK